MFNVSRKLVWLGGLYIIPTAIDVGFDNIISKKMFSVTFGKNLSASN